MKVDHIRCGGTIISEYHILTAAHCVIDDNNKEAALPENVKVRVGEHHLSRDDDTETVMDVKCIAVHPSYNGYVCCLLIVVTNELQ